MLKVKFDYINPVSVVQQDAREWLNEHLGEWLPVAGIDLDNEHEVSFITLRLPVEAAVTCVFLYHDSTAYTIAHGDYTLYAAAPNRNVLYDYEED